MLKHCRYFRNIANLVRNDVGQGCTFTSNPTVLSESPRVGVVRLQVCCLASQRKSGLTTNEFAKKI